MVTKTKKKDLDENHKSDEERKGIIDYKNFDMKMKFKTSFYLYHRAAFIYMMELDYSRSKAVQLTKMLEKEKVNMKPDDLKTVNKLEKAMLDVLGMDKEEIDKIPYKGLSDKDLENIKKAGESVWRPLDW